MGESTSSVLAGDQVEPPQTEPDPEPTVEAPVDTPKKKKKKKKDKVKEEDVEEDIMPAHQPGGDTAPELNGAMSEANGNEAGEKKKKKKKKDKHLKEEEEEYLEISPMELQGSDSSGYHSDKPSKKRKHETGADVASSFSENPELPKSKKKRKSGTEQCA